MKWFGLVLLLLGIAGALYLGTHEALESQADSEIFHDLWQKDLKTLQEAKKLPEGWKSLRMVEYTALDRDTWSWIENKKPDFAINPDGEYKLEILLDHFDDEEGKAALIEYHLINLKSGDKVWELGRTVKIRNENLAVKTEPEATPAISQ